MRKFFLALIILLAFTLRFYKLGTNPPSLYWDEASLGYNAYSILKTARDEHGVFLPLTNFAAFGDYKPPGYIYFTVPSVWLFGLNEFAIRFPSAFFGTLTVLVTYLLAKKLFQRETIALLAGLFLAISPWHLMLSRAAFESNLALFFSVLGIYFFVKFAKDSPIFIFMSAVSFLIALYTFTGQRLFVPFILLVLIFQFRKEITANLKYVLSAAFIGAVLFWPLFRFTTQTIEGKLRFEEVTIFKDLDPINRASEYRQRNNYSFLSNLLYNRRLFYVHEYLKHYFDAFSPRFLFTRGDTNPRFSTQLVGQLHLFDMLLLPFGIYLLIRKKNEFVFLILGWLFISPLGPATARETPHALRMLHILPTFQLISAFGIYYFINHLKHRTLGVIIFSFFIACNVFYFLHVYYVHWPKTYSDQWQFGYKEAVKIAAERYDQFDNIIVTKGLGRPYIYFLLYMKYPPSEFQSSGLVAKDKFYFLDVDGFDKLKFTNDPQSSQIKGENLYITESGSLPSGAKLVDQVFDKSGKTVFDAGEKIEN